MDELKQILSAVAFGPTGVSQFSIDWAETKHDTVIDREERPGAHCSENDFFGALHYDVDNILEVMRPDIPDVLFFEGIAKLAKAIFV